MSRRTQVLIAVAAALAAVVVIVKLAGGGGDGAGDVTTVEQRPVAVASAAAPQAPSIQNQLVVQPRWTRQATGEASAADFAHASLVAPSAAPLKPTEVQKVTPPEAQPNEVVHQLPSKATADVAAARAEDKFGPLSKRERMALERQVQGSKKQDRVPGTAQMRQNLLKNQCSGPQAQKDYQELATDAARAAFRRRCASFGFQPAP